MLALFPTTIAPPSHDSASITVSASTPIALSPPVLSSHPVAKVTLGPPQDRFIFVQGNKVLGVIIYICSCI